MAGCDGDEAMAMAQKPAIAITMEMAPFAMPSQHRTAIANAGLFSQCTKVYINEKKLRLNYLQKNKKALKNYRNFGPTLKLIRIIVFLFEHIYDGATCDGATCDGHRFITTCPSRRALKNCNIFYKI